MENFVRDTPKKTRKYVINETITTKLKKSSFTRSDSNIVADDRGVNIMGSWIVANELSTVFTPVCDSVHRGGGVSEQTQPQADPLGRPPPGQTPPDRHPL